MATHTNITIYLDNKPYRFDVTITPSDDITRYSIHQNTSDPGHLDWLPDEFVLTEDGRIESGAGIKTVEQEQVVRLIWQQIRDALNVPL